MTLRRALTPDLDQPPEGRMIQEAREGQGLSRTEVGARIGVSRNSLRTWERGKRSDERPYRGEPLSYARVCRAVGYTADQVVEWAEQHDLTPYQRSRFRLIAMEVWQLDGRPGSLDVRSLAPPEGLMTVDLVCAHLESLQDLCGHETLKLALERLGWIAPPTSDVHAS